MAWRWCSIRVPRNRRSAPLRSAGLKDNRRLQVRMGIHGRPVSGVVDVNERTNVAGAGINLAQRVMDCGDARCWSHPAL